MHPRTWSAIAASIAVLVGAALRVPSLHDPVADQAPERMELVLPTLYVVFSPLSRVLDGFGLLSNGQHVALILTILLVAILLGALRSANQGRSRMRSTLMSAAVALCILILVYGMTAALPRPMARLVAADSALVRVDLHSHTNASHDTRSSFDPEDNREWHQSGGFDVAYVTDHSTFLGAEAGMRRNPRAGEGTVQLSGFEGRFRGTFMLFLSMTKVDSVSLIDRRRHLRKGTLAAGRAPTAIMAIPGPLIDLPAAASEDPPRIAGVELVDGSPRGLAQRDRDGARIIHMADSLGISIVSGSNNHGWGRVIPAWTLISIPGWRALTPDSLAAAIEKNVYRSSGARVQVVERTRPHFTGAALAFTAPALAGQIIGTLTLLERVAWLAWIWLTVFILGRIRPRQTRKGGWFRLRNK